MYILLGWVGGRDSAVGLYESLYFRGQVFRSFETGHVILQSLDGMIYGLGELVFV